MTEKTVAPAAVAPKEWMCGSGYLSSHVASLKRLKSPHGRQLPLGFGTMCNGDAQGGISVQDSGKVVIETTNQRRSLLTMRIDRVQRGRSSVGPSRSGVAADHSTTSQT